MLSPVLHDFRTIRPRYSTSQQRALEWLSAAHAQADRVQGDQDASIERFLKAFRRVGCSPGQIAERGHELDDFNHQRWEDAEIFRLHQAPVGIGMEGRTRRFARSALSAFDRFYEDQSRPPDDLIHVTCTGYLSPSPAQALIEKKGWGEHTVATHAYHMGCYASLPAIRMARGFLAAEPGKRRVDIVHTELCTLHLNPADHSLENLVVQTLFADGYARYSLSPLDLLGSSDRGFEVMAVREEILRDTSGAMTWSCADFGMRMTLSKDVPGLVGRHLASFLLRLLEPLGIDIGALRAEGRFAIHPGGPKILDQVEDSLDMAPGQVKASREVLQACGNMSSATLPHIWKILLDDESVAPGSLVASLAFGPGLTLCGALFRKVGPR